MNWLYSYPMVAIILANIWRGTAFSMMIYQAALNDVPPEITEASMIDGAGSVKRFVYVTLPMIRRTITTNLMLITLQTLSRLHADLCHDGRRAGQPEHHTADLRLQGGIQVRRHRLRHGDRDVMLLIGAVFSIFYIRALRPEKA